MEAEEKETYMIRKDENCKNKTTSIQITNAYNIYLFNRQVGIRRNNGTRRKIHAFSRQIAAESSLLALQTLTEQQKKEDEEKGHKNIQCLDKLFFILLLK